MTDRASGPGPGDPARAIPDSILASLGLEDPVTLPGGSGLDATAEHLGRYPVLDDLGSGGMGSVVLVRDRELGRDIAAKVMHASGKLRRKELEAFVLEARVAGQLEHPNIVPVYELGRTFGGRLFFTMRRVVGKSLGLRLNELLAETVGVDDPAPILAEALPELLATFVQVCHAMEYTHSRGVIHRDLKPHNVMLGQYGEVQLMDWGLARILGLDPAASGSRPRVTNTVKARWVEDESVGSETPAEGSVIGTPAYMPPEQAMGKGEDRRVDIYALGAMLYHILTLRPPYQGNPLAMLEQLLAGQLVPPTERAPDLDIPWELEAVALKAMATDPDDRYPSVTDLRADIRRYLQGRRLRAASYTQTQRLRLWIARHKAAVGAAASVVIAALVLGALAVARMHGDLADAREAHRAEAGARFAVETELTTTRRALARALRQRAQALLARRRVPEARVLLAAAREHAPELIDPDAPPSPLRLLGAWQASSAAVVALRFGPRGERLLVGDRDGGVVLWQARGERLAAMTGHAGPLRAASFSPDGELVVTAAEDGARLWRALTGTALGAVPRDDMGPASGAAFHGSGDRFVVAVGAQLAVCAADGTPRARLKLAGPASAVTWLGDRVLVLLDGALRAWTPGERLAQPIVRDVRALAGRADEALVLRGDAVVAVRPGGPRGARRTVEDATALSASRDGAVAVVTEEGAILLDRALAPIVRVPGRVAAVSDDGSRLATADDQGRVRVWQLARGEAELSDAAEEARRAGLALGELLETEE